MISLKLRCVREYNRLYTKILNLFWRFQSRDSARVYMFHSVLNDDRELYSRFAISTASFEKFLVYELSRGQKPMDKEDIVRAIANPDRYRNCFAVSFDDIYDSVYTNAYPVLKRLRIPFIVFVTQGLIEKTDQASMNPMITKQHLYELMSDELCIVGSHGVEHKPFRQYSKEESLQVCTQSKTIMGRETDLFAFPYGRRTDVSKENIKCARKAGYCCAFSALDGSLKQKWLSGRWFLPRILVDEQYVRRHSR